jgi:hypothetical protein
MWCLSLEGASASKITEIDTNRRLECPIKHWIILQRTINYEEYVNESLWLASKPLGNLYYIEHRKE